MPCPFCASPAERILAYRGIPEAEPLLVEGFRARGVARCTGCEHVFADPMPDAALLDRYYAHAFRAPPPSLRARIGSSRAGACLRRLRTRLGAQPASDGTAQLEAIDGVLGRSLSGARTLEVGAGPASFSRAVRERHGAQVICDVAEPSDEWRTVYERHGLRRIAATLEGIDERERYLVIHAAHVVEHLPDALSALVKIGRLLLDGGVLFVEVPDCDAPYFRIHHHPDPPHVHFFGRRSLAALAKAAGFGVRSLERAGPPLAADPGFLEADTKELVGDRELARLLERRRAKGPHAGATLRLIATKETA